MSTTFRSLSNRNYRIYAIGALASNVGTWMQRTAQDWLVLAILTHHNATALGFVVALQFGPQLLMLPLSGTAADAFDRRKILIVTQALMGLLALGLGILTVAGWVRLWQVYIFAFALGCVAAFDAPARQAFVSELVGEQNLANAVALNSTSFNLGRTVGPALAGILIAIVGTGWVFLINAVSYVGVLAALSLLDIAALHLRERSPIRKGRLLEGFRYVRGRPDLIVVLAMLFLFGTFGLNFSIFISTMAVSVFHEGAGRYGLLTSAMACGSVSGALLAARREQPSLRLLIVAAALFGIGCAGAAVMPDYLLFALLLAAIGVCSQTFTTSSNSLVQLSTAPEMRGRVLSILFAIVMGGTPIGAPIIGWVADRLGPRAAMGVGAAAGFVAAATGLAYAVRRRGASVR